MPLSLALSHREHPWVFASYWEWGSTRDDDKDYRAFLFRDDRHATFGIREWAGSTPHPDFRKLAHDVVMDPAFRATLGSDDPELPDLWRGQKATGASPRDGAPLLPAGCG